MKLDSYRNGPTGAEAASELWVHPDGREVRLVGAMHLAHKSFYLSIADQISRSAAYGWDIHLERITAPKEGETLTPLEEEVLTGLKKEKEGRLVLTKILGLTSQNDGLEDEYKRFGSRDVSFHEVARSIDIDKLRKSMESESIVDRIKSTNPVSRWIFAKFLLLLVKNLASVYSFIGEQAMESSYLSEDFVLNHRNEVAVGHILASTHQKHYVFWGAAHLPGMGELLSREGFTRNHVTWNTVIPNSFKVPKRVKL
jgi:hypothetical protein